MKICLLLVFLATAVTALPSETPEVPPVPAVEAPETAFTEEASFDTAEAFNQVQDFVEKKGADACADLADATVKEVKSNIKQEQQVLNKMNTGAKCNQEGQDLVAAAKKALKNAEAAKVAADKALKDAQGAKVNFGDFTFSSLSPGNCQAMFGGSAYTSAKAKVDSAKKAAEKAAGAITGSKTAVDNAVAAAASAMKKCQCKAYKAHEQALEAANGKVKKANMAAWTKACHLKCVLAGTSASSCSCPSLPKVKAVSLAKGVDRNACTGTPINPTGPYKAKFPLTTPKGKEPQKVTGTKAVVVSGDYQLGFNVKASNSRTQLWLRGWYAPWKINKADLPVTLKFTYDPSGITVKSPGSNYKAYVWVGFDYVADNTQFAHYDCNLNFGLRLNPNFALSNYEKCSGTNTKCPVGNDGKPAVYEIRLAKDGSATSYKNGVSCGGFRTKVTKFPLYIDTALYGGKGVLRDLQLLKPN